VCVMLCEEMGSVPLYKKTDAVADGQRSENLVGLRDAQHE
jgi:hypothetical protein